MNNSKTTKRALFTSVMSLVLCCAMMIGTTFAWFTDTASTGISTIASGNLIIEVTDEDGNGTVEFENYSGSSNILWEPGCTFETEKITVKNSGNLALKYTIHVEGVSVNASSQAKLNEVIDFTIDGASMTETYSLAVGESKTFTISAHMQETAGNEYKDLTLENLKVFVSATQDTVEYDSTTDQYDKNAMNNDGVKIIGGQGTVTEGTYNGAKAYYVKFTGVGSPNTSVSTNYVYFGYNVDVSDYVAEGQYTYYTVDGSVGETVNYEDMGAFINDGIIQEWPGLRKGQTNCIYTYGYDNESDGTIDFYVIADVSQGQFPVGWGE